MYVSTWSFHEIVVSTNTSNAVVIFTPIYNIQYLVSNIENPGSDVKPVTPGEPVPQLEDNPYPRVRVRLCCGTGTGWPGKPGVTRAIPYG